MPATIWTIGHSTRPTEEFLALLAGARITNVVDVRRFPASRRYPQYGRDALAATLAADSIGYRWLEALGGRRRALPESPNSAWRNPAFRGYADYMSGADFEAGLAELLMEGKSARTAIMCAEALWWRCHRSMIADALCARDVAVVHIIDASHHVTHPMTAPARIVRGRLTYAGVKGG